jgi:excisionase family DNA binding protein
MDDPLLTPKELADYLRVPVKSTYAWRQRGVGPAGFRVGVHVRYRLSAVKAWEAAQTEADAERHALPPAPLATDALATRRKAAKTPSSAHAP